MTAIDVHAHVIVPDLLRDVAPSEAWRPSVGRVHGRQFVELAGHRIASAVDEFVDIDVILAHLETHGLTGVLLCPWVPLLFSDVDSAEALERCRLQNRGLASMRARSPERISVLGAVPLQDPELAAVELEVLMRTGGHRG